MIRNGKRGNDFPVLAALLCFLSVSLMSEVSARELYSAQLAVGSRDGLSARVLVIIMNTTDSLQSVDMSFHEPDGSLLSLELQSVGSSNPPINSGLLGTSVPPNYTESWELSSPGELTAGWIRFELAGESTEGVVIQVTFQNLDAQGRVVAAVGVPVRGAATEYLMAVHVSPVQDVGVALANPQWSATNVSLTLLTRGGSVWGELPLTLGPRQQLARFVVTGADPLFPSFSLSRPGRLLISADQPIAVLGLRADFSGPFLISSIPVTITSGQ